THKGSGKDYQVGPGKPYPNVSDVPMENLGAGDTMRIFWRPDPYRERMAFNGQGTMDQPIRIYGVPGPSGELPVIDGQDATTRPQLEFAFESPTDPNNDQEARGLIHSCHAHGNADYYFQPKNIVIEGLEIRNAGLGPDGAYFSFTDKYGRKQTWWRNAAGI